MIQKKVNYSQILILLLAISPFSVFFIKYPLSPMRDWDYFNSLGLLIGEGLKNFKLPLLDWSTCGGLDILANPQSWIFSPLSLLNFFFSPYLANLLSLVICAVVGMMGMYNLSGHVKNETDRMLVSMLFICSSFFFLHFSEGHIPYRTFYFLPWILYFTLNLEKVRQIWWLMALLVVMFLDGGIYPFYYSLILIFLNLNWRKLIFLGKKSKETLGLMMAGTAMLIGSKAIPVLFINGGRLPEFEIITYSIKNIVTALFDIRQTNYSLMSGQVFHFHEYGLYIGVGILLLFVRSLPHFKNNKRILFQVFLFLWISFGIGGVFNPWSLIKLIPYVNHIHIQSRFLILAYLMILFFISQSLNFFRPRWLLIIACMELLFCAFYTNNKAFTESRNVATIRSESVSDVVTMYRYYIPKPDVYSSRQLSYECYEPAQPKNRKKDLRLFIGTDNSDLSAIFSDRNITMTSKFKTNKPFVLNYNWNGGWDCKGCDAVNNTGLIEVRPENNSRVFVLSYNPVYRQVGIALYILGLGLFAYSGFRRNDVV